jgi:addiction module HigA family antidote
MTKPKNGLPPVHPGAFLREILGELGLSQAEFARAIGVTPMHVSHVVRGARAVTADLAVLLGRAFGQTPEYWLNLQAAYDLKTAKPITRRA